LDGWDVLLQKTFTFDGDLDYNPAPCGIATVEELKSSAKEPNIFG